MGTAGLVLGGIFATAVIMFAVIFTAVARNGRRRARVQGGDSGGDSRFWLGAASSSSDSCDSGSSGSDCGGGGD